MAVAAGGKSTGSGASAVAAALWLRLFLNGSSVGVTSIASAKPEYTAERSELSSLSAGNGVVKRHAASMSVSEG